MLIDLSRRPLMILPHECEGHIVVRTLQTSEVNSTVAHPYGRTRQRTHSNFYKPSASLNRNGSVLMETKLDVLQFRWPEVNVGAGGQPILLDPYEVSCAFRDTLTGHMGAWHHFVQLQRRHDDSWVIMIGLQGQAAQVAVIARDIILRRDAYCEFPLYRHIKKVAETGTITPPESVWDRLTQDD